MILVTSLPLSITLNRVKAATETAAEASAQKNASTSLFMANRTAALSTHNTTITKLTSPVTVKDLAKIQVSHAAATPKHLRSADNIKTKVDPATFNSIKNHATRAPTVSTITAKQIKFTSEAIQRPSATHGTNATNATNATRGAMTKGVSFILPQSFKSVVLAQGENVMPAARPASTAAPKIVSIGAGWPGLNSGPPNPCGCTPLDSNGAAGPNSATNPRGTVFETVNTAGQIWDKSGNTLAGPFDLHGFFGMPSGDFIADPFVKFDVITGHWWATIIDVAQHNVYLAVSTTSDPINNPWNRYTVVGAAPLMDQPFSATNGNIWVMSYNGFGGATNGFIGTEEIIVSWSDLINGNPSPSATATGLDPNTFSIHPVVNVSPSPAVYAVTVSALGSNVYTLYTFTGPASSPGIASTSFASSSGWAPSITPPQAQQPGGDLLNTNDGRMSDAFYQNGLIWSGFNDGCTVNGSQHSCIRLDQIDVIHNQVLQDFDLAIIDGDVYYPALTADNFGNLLFTFGYTSAADHVFPSMVDGDQFVQAPNTIDTLVYSAVGSVDDTSGRYGDYWGASPDPSNPFGVWFVGQYNVDPAGMSTFIENAAFGGPGVPSHK